MAASTLATFSLSCRAIRFLATGPTALQKSTVYSNPSIVKGYNSSASALGKHSPSRIEPTTRNQRQRSVTGPSLVRCFASSVSSSMAAAASGSILPADSPTVSVEWLKENLDSVKVLDSSWYMPVEKRNPIEEYKAARIPGALFFDIDLVADHSTQLPHMLPSARQFSAAMAALGLTSSDDVVVYDGKGIFSAPRAWWMFRAFGHERVRVLDGGLPRWRLAGLSVDQSESDSVTALLARVKAAMDAAESQEQSSSPFVGVLQQTLVWDKDQVKRNMESKERQLFDARSKGRFNGTDPEPRPGIPSGHIPESFNVPFFDVLTADGTLKGKEELESIFRAAGLHDSWSSSSPSSSGALVSCGTGVTACIIGLALHKIGRKEVPVYDGSWTEWASSSDTRIVTNT